MSTPSKADIARVMATLGAKGGSASTPAQQEARRKALVVARERLAKKRAKG